MAAATVTAAARSLGSLDVSAQEEDGGGESQSVRTPEQWKSRSVMTQLPVLPPALLFPSLCLGRDDVTGDTFRLFSHNKREEKRAATNCTAAAAAGIVFAQIIFCEMQTEHRRVERRGGRPR